MKWRTAWNLLLNYGVIVPLYFYFGLAIAGVGMRFHDFPSSGEIVGQMVILVLADDFIYMCIHRIFHEVPFLYKFHKIHHEYETVFSGVGQYAHPLEEIFGNLVSQ